MPSRVYTYEYDTTYVPSFLSMYEITLEIGGLFIPKLQVVGDKQNQQMILGRDVLNNLIVTLNGLAGVVEVAD